MRVVGIYLIGGVVKWYSSRLFEGGAYVRKTAVFSGGVGLERGDLWDERR